LGGTGALRVGFEFVKTHIPGEVKVPTPTWSNHNLIIERAGLN
jgi:aspartate/tyrosine/aromatic aminotransferase